MTKDVKEKFSIIEDNLLKFAKCINAVESEVKKLTEAVNYLAEKEIARQNPVSK